jgi:hypothetical protein
MNCPHCHHPIDPALVRKAANTDAGKRKRPGAQGLVRNPAGRPKVKCCDICQKPLGVCYCEAIIETVIGKQTAPQPKS